MASLHLLIGDVRSVRPLALAPPRPHDDCPLHLDARAPRPHPASPVLRRRATECARALTGAGVLGRRAYRSMADKDAGPERVDVVCDFCVRRCRETNSSTIAVRMRGSASAAASDPRLLATSRHLARSPCLAAPLSPPRKATYTLSVRHEVCENEAHAKCRYASDRIKIVRQFLTLVER